MPFLQSEHEQKFDFHLTHTDWRCRHRRLPSRNTTGDCSEFWSRTAVLYCCLLACPFCCRSHHSILLDIASWLSSVRLYVCLSGWLVDIFFFVVCGAVQTTSQPASHPSIQLVVSQPASQFALCLCHTNFILVWLFGTFSCGFSSGNQQQQQQ